jgi:hypothetical protein
LGFSVTDKNIDFDSGYQTPPSKEYPGAELPWDGNVPTIVPAAPPSDEWASFSTSLSSVKKKKKSKKSALVVEEAAPPRQEVDMDDFAF